MEADSGEFFLLDPDETWEEIFELAPGQRYAPRHRMDNTFVGRALELKDYIAEGVVLGFKKLLEHDLLLASASALIVMGFVVNMVGFALYALHTNTDLAFGLTCCGIGLWMLALTLFGFFMAGQEPKHRRRR